jgi:SSS family solute:Na+ symporter
MFIALRLMWMSLLVYLTAEAMTIMIGVGRDWIPVIALITGLVAVIYTSMGGLRAVVITDLIQTLLLYGGALLVLGVITYDFGGFGWFPTQWQENWDPQPLLPIDKQTGAFDPKIRVSALGSMFGFLIWYICTSGGDQTSVQRFMATRDVRAARRAYATQLVVSVIVGVTLAFVGFALLAYFRVHADQLPAGMSLKDDADKIFPIFIADHLPVGISGLVVAAMFAAAMSSIDSGVNSITAVVMTDFVDRFGHSPKTEKAHVRAAQFLALAIGTVVVIGSSFMEHITGNITEMTGKTSNLFTTPIFCLFFFALFVPFARPAGVIVGAVCVTVTAAVVAFCGPLVVWLSHWGVDAATFNTVVVLEVDKATGILTESAKDPISFQWIAPAAVLVNIVTGVVASLIIAKWNQSRDNLE